ncbi:MAG: IclR family transcriptional regulator C-terminal domain-containing protein [Burkholderiales bacterium]
MEDTPSPIAVEPSLAEEPGQAARSAARLDAADAHAVLADQIERFGDDPDFVTALARGLAVLLALSDKRRRMSIAQVSHRIGIPRAAVRRSLHTLAKLGFVAVDDARRFYLRPRVLSFSHGYLSASPLAILAQPILDRLGESLREAVSLATLDGDEIVYLARSASSRIMSPSLNVGRRLPAYCTSIGHVLLAHLPPAELDEYLRHVRFYPYTQYTPTSAEALLPHLASVRESGYAFASQLMEPRLCTLAVPVRDAGGHYVAGINLILQGRLVSREEMAERYYQPLLQAAMDLGASLLP